MGSSTGGLDVWKMKSISIPNDVGVYNQIIDGKKVTVVVTPSYVALLDDQMIALQGNVNLMVNGNVNQLVNGDVKHKILGNCEFDVDGDIKMNAKRIFLN